MGTAVEQPSDYDLSNPAGTFRVSGLAAAQTRRGNAVADVQAAVADTHALLYYAGGSVRLRTKATRHFEACDRRDALTYVPDAVMWEVGLLARGGRVNLRRSVRAFFTDLYSNPAYQPYDLTPTQIFDADELRFTRDPFDALVCAAARELGLPLLTRDTAITGAAVVRVIW